MPALLPILLPIGTAVTKFLIKSVIGDGIINTVIGGSVDIGAKMLGSQKGAEKADKAFQRVGEEVARSLEPLFSNSRDVNGEAVAHAVSETLGKLPGMAALIEANLSDEKLLTALKNVRQLPPGQFSQGEMALYYSTLAVLAPRLNEVVPQLKGFEQLFSGAVLGNLDEILESVKAESSAVTFARYEKLYLKTIREDLDYMELFGAGIDPSSALHPLLSIAYVSLNLRQGEGEQAQNIDAQRLLDSLHANNSKLLIVGEAGGGKSTLMRWIAMEVANWQFGLRQEHPGIYLNEAKDDRYSGSGTGKAQQNVWQKRVPFLIRLRALHDNGYRLPDLDKIPLLEAYRIGDPPPGYMQSVVDSGRALFLVDGIDEVPDDQRTTLMQSLNVYFNNRGNCFVLTSRPAAVEKWGGWLERHNVSSARVNDLSPTESRQLVYTWHRAVRRTIESSNSPLKQVHLEGLEGIEEALLETVETHGSLASLMGNPLLCSMICALHWWQSRQLPQNLIEVCEDLCKVLLHERALLAGVKEKDFVACYAKLDYYARRQIVQNIAVAMVKRDWLSEISGLDAEEIVAEELEDLEGANRDDAGQVLAKLVERSGMLRARSGVTDQLEQLRLEFIHNTFKEYLAAEWLVNEDLPTLVDNIGNSDWKNVLLFASGNRRNKNIGKQIIQGLLNSDDKSTRLFALRCRAVLRFKAQELDEQLEKFQQESFPPKDEEEAIAVSAIGNDAVPHLGYRDNLSEEQAKACVIALGRINSAAAREVATAYVNDERVFHELVRVVNPLLIPRALEIITSDTSKTTTAEEVDWRHQIDNLIPLRALTDLQSLNLNRAQVSDLTPLQNLANLRRLNLFGTQISDLKPLQKLTNLRSLSVASTQVSDLTPLQGLLDLRGLSVNSTKVSDLTPLRGLINLRRLIVSRTQVNDLTPLQNLTDLQSLDLNTLELDNLTLLQVLTNLHRLILNNTQIHNITPLQALTKLEVLDLSNTQVSDLTPLQRLINLQRLNLSTTKVNNLTPIQGLTNLQRFHISHTEVSDLAPLQRLTNLQSLSLSNTAVSNLEILKGLINLEELSLVNTQVSDLMPLESLFKLRILDLDITQVSNLTPLQHLTSLQILNLRQTEVSDLTPLSKLLNLQSLSIDISKLNDLTPLQGLANLQTLNLLGTEVEDLSPLQGMVKLEHLDLDSTHVINLTPLKSLVNLQTLDLRNTGVYDLTPLQELVNLRTLHLNTGKEKEFIGLTEQLRSVIRWVHSNGSEVEDNSLSI